MRDGARRGRPSVGLAIIARDEETTLPALLESAHGAFDQWVLVDTGSTDATVQRFDTAARIEEATCPGFRSTLARFEWCDDFAAARNYASSLLTTDWHVWADCDDVIVGALKLRELAAGAPPEITAFGALYTAAGAFPIRRRLLRAGCYTWENPVDEWPRLREGSCTFAASDLVRWVHTKPFEQTMRGRADRDLRIAQAWAAREPDNLLARQSVETYTWLCDVLAKIDASDRPAEYMTRLEADNPPADSVELFASG